MEELAACQERCVQSRVWCAKLVDLKWVCPGHGEHLRSSQLDFDHLLSVTWNHTC